VAGTLNISARTLAAIDDLSVLARTVVEGFLDGCTAVRFLATARSSPRTALTRRATICATSIGRSGVARMSSTSSNSRTTRTALPDLLDTSASMDSAKAMPTSSTSPGARRGPRRADGASARCARAHPLWEEARQVIPPRRAATWRRDTPTPNPGAGRRGHAHRPASLPDRGDPDPPRSAVVISDSLPRRSRLELLRQLQSQRQESSCSTC